MKGEKLEESIEGLFERQLRDQASHLQNVNCLKDHIIDIRKSLKNKKNKEEVECLRLQV